MEGIRFVVDQNGDKVAVQIDLDHYGYLLEDLFDQIRAGERLGEKRQSLATVKKRLGTG